MFEPSKFRVCLLLICLFSMPLIAQKAKSSGEILVPKGYMPPVIENSRVMQAALDQIIGRTLTELSAKGYKPEEIAATLIDLSDPKKLTEAGVRGEQRIYPASVVKMFYLAALERQLGAGRIAESKELRRGERDMIVDSSNEATQYILDVLTGTSSGAELPKKQFDAWQYKRNRVNRYYSELGYKNINVNQKTFCEDAYGIEQQSRQYRGENRNMLTTNATARLMAEIVLGRMAGVPETAKMLELMKRDPFAGTKDSGDQAHGFTGKVLIDRGMKDARIWSKAGWTSKARHDAAYIETADGLKFVLVIFTENHATDAETIPLIAGRVIDKLRELRK